MIPTRPTYWNRRPSLPYHHSIHPDYLSPPRTIVTKGPVYMPGLGAVIVAGALLTACGGGPSGTEFVDACLQEGQSAASQMLDKELGVTREAFCKCGEAVARSSLSSDGYRAMVLQMQGKGEEARAIMPSMNESGRIASVEVLGKMMEQCAVEVVDGLARLARAEEQSRQRHERRLP